MQTLFSQNFYDQEHQRSNVVGSFPSLEKILSKNTYLDFIHGRMMLARFRYILPNVGGSHFAGIVYK